MAIAENKTVYVLPGSGEAGLYFPPKPIIVANIKINACTIITTNLYIKPTTSLLVRLYLSVSSVILVPLNGPFVE